MSIHRFMYWLMLVVMMAIGGIAGLAALEPFRRFVEHSLHAAVPDLPLTRVGFGLVGLLVGILVANEGYRLLSYTAHRLEEAEPDEKLAIGLGVVVGSLITLALYPILFAIGGSRWGWALFLIALVVIVYLSVVSFLSMKDYLPITAQMSRRSRGVKLLDTNVIIDGRIADIIRAGFLEGRLYVPGFVLDELQRIADSEDPLKRARGRRGLDVLRRLQQDYTLELRNQDRLAPPGGDEVDSRLVRLARAMHGDIVTNDYNLNKVAELQGVRVLNINELAEAVRIHVLPGEELTVTLIREGKEPEQGVAYLEDGTMVIVEGGKPYLHQTIEVIVTSVLQTNAGKMIFSELREDSIQHDDNLQSGLRAYTGGRKRRPIR